MYMAINVTLNPVGRHESKVWTPSLLRAQACVDDGRWKSPSTGHIVSIRQWESLQHRATTPTSYPV